ncbi:LCP family glycopolymer transferase [Lyngbya aestuarii]|uniref:LCP family glycopolymer transferase n=1 Tax=Lyngbya aestuarii TaxID=118322 RepID=UPI00403E1D4C
MKKDVKQSPTGVELKFSRVPSYSQTDFTSGILDDVCASQPQLPVPEKVKVSHPPRDESAHVSDSNPAEKPYLRWFFWSATFLLTATLSAGLGATVALITPLSPLLAPLNQGIGSKEKSWSQSFQYNLARPVNILVMGIDLVPDAANTSPEVLAGRSDTMLLLRLDPTDHSVRMLSIPRDTQVEIPSVGIDKINDANVKGGPGLAARIVSRTLNDVSIDRYLRITTDAFRELVDLVGGVEVFVPYPMEYVDVTQNLEINLDQGWQTLNGDQAEQFARFRNYEGGDIARIQRQQILLKAIQKRLFSPTVLPRLPKLVQIMQQYIDTNLSWSEILALVGFGLELKSDDFKMVLLPGRFSTPDEYAASYWIMDTAARDRVMREYFDQKPEWEVTERRPSPHNLRIAIQNATDDPQLSRRVVRYLAKKEFYNVYLVQDWPDHQRQTQIIVQQGDLEAAITLKKILGLGKVEASSTGIIGSELTIRVGEDWLDQQAQGLEVRD